MAFLMWSFFAGIIGVASENAEPPDIVQNSGLLSRYEASGSAVSNIDFHRNEDGTGEVYVYFSKTAPSINMEASERLLEVTFLDVGLEENVSRRLKVDAFATPVLTVELIPQQEHVHMIVKTDSDFRVRSDLDLGQIVFSITPADQKVVKESDNEVGKHMGELISLNFQSIGVRQALQIIADFNGLNLVISDAVDGDLSLSLKDVPWDQALDVVLQTKGLAMQRSGSIMWIATAEEMVETERRALELQKATVELEPLKSELIRVSYAKVEDIAAMVKSVRAIETGVEQSIFGAVSVNETKTEENSLLSERGSVTVDTRTNSLLIQDTASKLAEIRKLISLLDVPVRQVQIETRIITAHEDFSKNIGARLGFTRVPNQTLPTGMENSGVSSGGHVSITNPLGSDDALSVNLPASAIGGEVAGAYAFTLATLGAGFLNLLDLEISALQAQGNGRVLANPKILTTDKHKASIEQGQERLTTFGSAFGTSSSKGQKAVLSLTVLPQITQDNHVVLDVDITNDAFVSASADTVNTRRINTQTLLKDGETVVIGGIYTEERFGRVTKVPTLGDVPYLGALFRKRVKRNNRSELLIFLTPRIIHSALDVQ